MTLTIIGLGLGNERDITIAGLEAIKAATKIYLETYTSFLSAATKEDLESFYQKPIIEADRTLVEQKAEIILEEAKTNNIAFLVVGDPFSATTHHDLKQRARNLNIQVDVIPNTSIMTAIGITGLDLYKFGRTTTIPFDNEDISSPLEVIENNLKNKLHSLVLLDLDVANKKTMKFSEAIQYLLEKGLKDNQLAIGCAQLGSQSPIIEVAKAAELKNKNIDKYPQCLIIPAALHFMEEEALERYK